MWNLLEFPIAWLSRPLLYSRSSRWQHLDDGVHRLLSLCYSLGMLYLTFWYTFLLLLTMIWVLLLNNQGKDHNTKYFSTIQLTYVPCLRQLNNQQKATWIKFPVLLLIIEMSSGVKSSAYIPNANASLWVVPSFDGIYFPPVINNLKGFMLQLLLKFLDIKFLHHVIVTFGLSNWSCSCRLFWWIHVLYLLQKDSPLHELLLRILILDLLIIVGNH